MGCQSTNLSRLRALKGMRIGVPPPFRRLQSGYMQMIPIMLDRGCIWRQKVFRLAINKFAPPGRMLRSSIASRTDRVRFPPMWHRSLTAKSRSNLGKWHRSGTLGGHCILNCRSPRHIVIQGHKSQYAIESYRQPGHRPKACGGR